MKPLAHAALLYTGARSTGMSTGKASPAHYLEELGHQYLVTQVWRANVLLIWCKLGFCEKVAICFFKLGNAPMLSLRS